MIPSVFIKSKASAKRASYGAEGGLHVDLTGGDTFDNDSSVCTIIDVNARGGKLEEFQYDKPLKSKVIVKICGFHDDEDSKGLVKGVVGFIYRIHQDMPDNRTIHINCNAVSMFIYFLSI